MGDVLRKQPSMDFDEAVKHVEKTISEEGFSILLTKSIDDMMKKKLGLADYPRYTIILACVPELAKMALDVSKDVGNLFPCSFVVYEDQGNVSVSHISIMKIAAAVGLAPRDRMAPVIDKTGEKVHKAWNRF